MPDTTLKAATQRQREELTNLLGPAMRGLAKSCRDIFRDRAGVEALLGHRRLADERHGVGQVLVDKGIGRGRAVVPDDAAQLLQPRLVRRVEDQIDGTRVGVEENDGIFG